MGAREKKVPESNPTKLDVFLFSGGFFCYPAHMLIGPTRLAVMAQLMRLQLIYGNAVNVYVRPGACTCTTQRAVNRTPNTRLHSSQHGIDPVKMGEGVERLRILLPRLAPQFVTHPFPDPILDHTPYELPLGPHI